jgi:pimeloyl-ACP methyl ester carboxylesterase
VTWSDSDGQPEKRFTKDELLTNITIYWVTASATSSARMYFEVRAEPHHYMERRVEVPTACANFAGEISRWPRQWVEAQYNLVRWSEIPRGGHFAAFEEPALFVDDVREFFRDRR